MPLLGVDPQVGKEMLDHLPMNFRPAVWWLRKAVEINFNATWIPQQIPTMVIGGEFDAMTPFSLFMRDKRFDRVNISKHLIQHAGHFPWLENPTEINRLFTNFLSKIN